MNKIICTNEAARNRLKQLEKEDLSNIILDITNDKNYVDLLETLYMDAYLLLKYKNKMGITSDEENKLLIKLKLILTQEFTLYLIFQNDKTFVKQLMVESSIFRNCSELVKSKIYYLLDEVGKGILSKIDYKLYSELKQYDLGIAGLKRYIINTENEDVSLEIYRYLMFLYTEKKEIYNQLVFKIRRFNNDKSLNIDIINKEEIDLFVKNVKDSKIIVKIHNIGKE